ncbi:MAG: TCR/Tet family MFS transporter [Alphaproteobacteria bacterium]|nr:TCR/Tet family MFS transporter [Alphaproteobacteria bacterium]
MQITHKTPALKFIFFTVFLDLLAFGLIVPVLPKLLSSFSTSATPADTVFLIGVFGTIWALMQFIFSPLLGMLSDRFGRRPVILLSALGLGLDYIIMALAPSLLWLFLGRLLSGITSANVTTANAYISDVTRPEERSKAYGILGGAFGAGFIIGPALGGMLSDIHLYLPFWFAAGCSFLNVAYGFFVLPESLPRKARKKRLEWKKANPVGAISFFLKYPKLIKLAIINFLGNLAHEVYIIVFVLYTITRYEWSNTTVGLALTTAGVSAMIVAVMLVGPIVKRLGDRGTLFVGMIFGAIGFVLFGLADKSWVFLVAIPVNALWALSGPPIKTLMTQHVPISEQGELQGALGSINSIAMLIGPSLFSTAYAIGLSSSIQIPGIPWFLASTIICLAGILAYSVLRESKKYVTGS